MQTPNDLRYSSDHEWAKSESGSVRVGITDYAQDALGDVVYVDSVPGYRTVTVTVGGVMGEVESTKSVSEIYAPVSGTIAAVNDALTSSPELVNSDPYGEGWICEIATTSSSDYDALLDASAYEALTTN